MKNLKSLIWLLLLALGLTACDPSEENTSLQRSETLQIITGETQDVTLTSATMQGTINAFSWSYTEIGIAYRLESNAQDVTYAKVTGNASAYRTFSITLNGLQPDASYIYYAYAKDTNGKLILADEQKTFRTKSPNDLMQSHVMQYVAMYDATLCWDITNKSIYNELQDATHQTSFGVAWSKNKRDLTPVGSQFNTNTATVVFNQWYKGFAKLSQLNSSTVYYYVIYLITGGEMFVSPVSSFVTMAETDFAGTTPSGLLAVDLGLPSGTKWANMNLGAENAEESGLFYAWGETTGFHSEISDGFIFNWANYKWCRGNRETLTKYCTNSDYGIIDNKALLDLADDIAYINWGDSWRMPNTDEINELIEYTENKWTTLNGVIGCRFTSTSTGNSIFLPAAGCRVSESHYDEGQNCYYWSASLDIEHPFAAYYLGYKSKVFEASLHRYYGMNIRPVLRH